MSSVFIIFFGLAAGVVGTGLGGLIAFAVNRRGVRFMSFIMEFSAGLMLSVVCFDLLPHAFEHAGLTAVLTGMLAGMLFVFAVSSGHRYEGGAPGTDSERGLTRIGITMAVSIAVHNLPEGMAIGAGFESSLRLGLSLAAVIFCHNIPEGMALVLPFRAAGMKPARGTLISVLAGLPMVAGAAIGTAAGQISAWIISLCLAIAAGAMLYVVMADMIPYSKSIYTGRISSIGNILGVILGIIITVGLGG